MLPPLLPSIVRNVIYPIYRGLRGDKVLTVLRELERNQWLSRGELEDIQWRLIESYLDRITTHVPYYRDLFSEAGLKVEDIQNTSDFQKIPLLTRERVRTESSRLVTRDPMIKGYPSSTGGSTGEPLYFYCDHSAGLVRRANTLRGYRWTGVDVGDRQVLFWGFHLDVSLRERLVDSVKNYFNNIMHLSTFDMSDASMRGYAARLRRFKPGLVVGYPSALSLFAEYCKRHRVRVSRPRAVVTSGERLFAGQREILEEIFSCPVFDRYGTREFANIANECEEHRGLHVFSDLFHVEVLHESGRPAQSGEIGELVVTDLSNLYMPFLRYRTGDLAVPTGRTCPCGRGLPLLDRIEGRAFDAVITPDGKSVGGFFWTWLSRAVPGIRQFQVEQRERSGIIFRIVPAPEWKSEYEERLAGKIRENCGDEFRVNFMITDEISLTPSGKSRFIVSNLEQRLVIKSKIHKANITGEAPGDMDCLIIDERLMELGDVAPYEKILIVDVTNGARIETFAVRGGRDSGDIISGGAVSRHIHTGDEISIMAFTWSEDTAGGFSNILVDGNNRFVSYLTEVAGEKI